MAKQEPANATTNFEVSLQKPYDKPLAAYAFDKAGRHLATAHVEKNAIQFGLSEKALRSSQVFIAPLIETRQPTPKELARVGGYPLSVVDGVYGKLRPTLVIPGSVIDHWWLCLCKIEGRVVRPSGVTGNTVDLPVCGARVHICEVDRWPWILEKLPDPDIYRLRDDLLRELLEPRIPVPPLPDPDRLFRYPVPTPVMPRSPLSHATMAKPAQATSPAFDAALGVHVEAYAAKAVATDLHLLSTASSTQLRKSLLSYVDVLQLYLCHWPWLWGWFTCDEIAVVETDAFGRFEYWLLHDCSDHPDVYFWVEYPIDGVYQTVYRPYIGCATHWDYACGTEVTIRVTDPRVPTCGGDPDLDGLTVAVMSIGREVSLNEVQQNGLTTAAQPFGGKIEPRVWFGRSALIAAGISHFRWSYRRLTAPDGATAAVGTWTILTRDVVRHYSVLGSDGLPVFPVYPLGPDADNKFTLQPLDPPSPGIDWETLDEREDLATAHFETLLLPHGLPGTPSAAEKAAAAAGLYELKLELLRSDNSIVNWTAAGVSLAIADDPAPFGTETVDTVAAPAFNRLLDSGGDLVGFRMVLRVDNNLCSAEIFPITGSGITPDPDCGFIEYAPGASATLSFKAKHPWGFATFGHSVVRGNNTGIAEANASGTAGDSSATSTGGNYAEGPDFVYSKAIPVNTLLTANAVSPCAQAAFAQSLGVWSTATDGYGRLNYDDSDLAAFALATPCDCGPEHGGVLG